MAKIKMVGSAFTVIPEGMHTFKVLDCRYDETFGKIEVDMITERGEKHTEKFTLFDGKNKPNNGAFAAFSWLAKCCLNNFSVDEIDHKDIIGTFVNCEVKHTIVPSRDDPTKTITFVNLGRKEVSSGFANASSPVVDLNSLLD